MPDIASSDVTYAIQNQEVNEKYKVNRLKLDFGNGVLTYPAGGVPLDANKLGMPNEVRDLVIYDAEDAQGLLYKFDSENLKIRIYEGDYAQAGDAPLVELDGGADTPAATELYVRVEGW